MLSCGNERGLKYDLPFWRTVASLVGILLSAVRATSQPLEVCAFSSSCNCSSDGTRVECQAVSWPTVQPADGSSVLSLSVTGLQQRSLLPADFGNLSALEFLSVTDGLLFEVSRDVFSGLLQLETLVLSRNQLKIFPTDVFMDNARLKNLVLSGNPITLPVSGTFLRSESLQYLDISSCSLSKLQPEVFSGFPQLQELHLGNNNLVATCMPRFDDVYFQLGSGKPLTLSNRLDEVRQPPLLNINRTQQRRLPAPPSGSWTPTDSPQFHSLLSNQPLYETISPP
ncbi:leucine-rich repeat transmembrane neuronal protein 2-like [Schistocerca serialis cubense]|uniref:leucine-rich repeat transmembrane neuronal protein 2-like n=1 Tax=Schistocerca serialis cubense TaxID=2023355 RepID=UPI00214DF171|nr:leucine-rich repeat transmembrane neuronal protein 2-like [Schistocerca serialis cubense]